MRFQTKVDDFSEDETGVTVMLHDGKDIRGDMLVAADGVRSRLRQKILADLAVHPEPKVISTTSHPIKISWADAQKNSDLVELFRNNDSQLAFVDKPGCYVIMRKYERLDLVSGYVYGTRTAIFPSFVKSFPDALSRFERSSRSRRMLIGGSCQSCRTSLDGLV